MIKDIKMSSEKVEKMDGRKKELEFLVNMGGKYCFLKLCR
jgi:translation elongation factor P/translation initiation factor 5A